MQIITRENLAAMISIHMRADPYSPYGEYKASWEAEAQRSNLPAQRRALWLLAARHWRVLMGNCAAIGDTRRYWRAYKFARIAISAAHYA